MICNSAPVCVFFCVWGGEGRGWLAVKIRKFGLSSVQTVELKAKYVKSECKDFIGVQSQLLINPAINPVPTVL